MAKAKPLIDTAADVPEQFADPMIVSDPAPEIPVEPPTVSSPQRRGSGFLGMVAGGAIAAALGFGVALYAFPNGWQPVTTPSSELTDLTARLNAAEARLGEIDTSSAPADPRIEGLIADVSALRAAVETLPQQAGEADPRIGTLEQRLTALEAMPVGEGGSVSPAVIGALQADIVALRSQSQEQQGNEGEQLAAVEAAAKAAQDDVAAARAELDALVAKATATLALGRLQSALDAGSPLGPALAELEAAGVAPPQVLVDAGPAGIPTLVQLQDSFPADARAALEAARRANPGEGWTDRLGTFLQSQTGARSLTPTEGSDPDAVLSRAEDTLRQGNLTGTLDELGTLPPEAATALADWVAKATLRIDALAAVDGLAGNSP